MIPDTNEHGQATRLAVLYLNPRRFLGERPGLALTLALLAGLMVRLGIAPLGVHVGDYADFTNWATALAAHPLLDIYRTSTANYPPLALLLLDGSRLLFSAMSPGSLEGPLWLVCLKLPPILADTGIGWLAWRAAERRGAPRWLPLSIIFNPALIYLSAWWGQYDSVYMLPALAALLLTIDGRFGWAGLLIGAGIMVKFQTAMFGLAVVLAAFRAGGGLKARAAYLAKLAATSPLATLACLGPYAANGQLASDVTRLFMPVSEVNWPTLNALNTWYVLTLGKGNWVYNQPLTLADSTPVLFGLSIHTLGLILFAAWLAAVVWLGARRRRDGGLSEGEMVLWAGAMINLGLFLLPSQMHERYALGVVILTGALAIVGWGSAARRGRWAAAYGLITLLHLLNLVWAAPFDPALTSWFSGQLAWGLPIALATLGLAGWLLALPGDRRPA